MQKILFLISVLLTFSFSFTSPLYAAAHEKKTDNATTMEADTANSDNNKKKEGEPKEDEEPDCD